MNRSWRNINFSRISKFTNALKNAQIIMIVKAKDFFVSTADCIHNFTGFCTIISNVAAFKPIKTGWKEGVDWTGEDKI
jgi:transcription initiation factor TFIID subunit TAF12